MAVIAIAWFGTSRLGLVIGTAMIVNLLAAALAGIFIPLGAEPHGLRPRGCLDGVRDDGDGRRGLLLVPGPRLDLAGEVSGRAP